MMLFEWLYPTYTPILLRAVAIWFADPTVTTPILKLMAELVQVGIPRNAIKSLHVNF